MPMNNFLNCDTAIEEILNMIGRPSLDAFQNMEQLLNLIQELKEEPRDENNYKKHFQNLLIPNEAKLTPQQKDIIILTKFKVMQTLFVDQNSLLD
jgi:hypothetical protein